MAPESKKARLGLAFDFNAAWLVKFAN